MKKVVVEISNIPSIKAALSYLEIAQESCEITYVLPRVPGESLSDAIMGIVESLADYTEKFNKDGKTHIVSSCMNFDDLEGFWVRCLENMKEKLEKYGFCSPGVFNKYLKHAVCIHVANNIGADTVIVGDDADGYQIIDAEQGKDINAYLSSKYSVKIFTPAIIVGEYNRFIKDHNLQEEEEHLRVDNIGYGGWTTSMVGHAKAQKYIDEWLKPALDEVIDEMHCMGFEFE